MDDSFISTPDDELRQFITKRAAHEGFASAKDYLRFLSRTEQKRVWREYVEEKVLEGLRSQPVRMTDEIWDAMEKRILDLHPELNEEEQAEHEV